VAQLGGRLQVQWLDGTRSGALTAYALLFARSRQGQFQNNPGDLPPSVSIGYGNTQVSVTYTP
jgi:hypothetical protein